MNVYKKWSFLLIASLALLIIFNFMIWHFFTEDILTFEKYCNGDLTRIGIYLGFQALPEIRNNPAEETY